DARAGRWAGQAKTECGIHLSGLEASLTDAAL
ncbi:MAG: phosphoadenylyl-sulfate reductase, partial [Mesorhizobium sp.]